MSLHVQDGTAVSTEPLSYGLAGKKSSCFTFFLIQGEPEMKKLLFVAAVVLSSGAYAAILKTEVIEGLKKICIYSDGSTITISSVGICPLSK
jgi:hypothetical protein